MGQQEAKPGRQESKPAKNATRRAKGTLTKEEVVREAMRLIEQEGVDACSMRNVATRVGVTAMALYSYVPSRDALLNEACVAFLSTVDARPRPGERWDDTLIRCMRALRNACMQHPRIAALTNDPAVGAGLEPYLMRLLALFLAQGMPEEIAIQLTVAADAFFAGFMLRSGQLVERVHDGDGSQAATGRKGRAGTGDASASTHSAAPAHPADASKRLAVTSRVPGMLTGRTHQAPPPVPNEHWRRTTAAGYSASSFENGLLIIAEGLRACLDPYPCDWRTP